MAVRPNLQSLLAHGDEEMYERMAKLIEPGPHQAGILFCDLHESGNIARQLSTSAYFKLVRSLWTGIDDDDPTARLGMLLLVAALQLVLMASLLRFVFRGRGTPGPQLILPAISVYLLLGGFFANISAALELLAPGSYDAAGTEATLPWQTLLYYSYVTMLTVGFGDIVPVTPWARSLAAFAAVTATCAPRFGASTRRSWPTSSSTAGRRHRRVPSGDRERPGLRQPL
jgi:hypothetical protein